MSMKPGATMRPAASMTRASGAFNPYPTPAIRPPSTRMSETPSAPVAGSTTRPFRMSVRTMAYRLREAFGSGSVIRTPSLLSISLRRTWTSSRRDVGRSFPV
jgi:hypothetical protein